MQLRRSVNLLAHLDAKFGGMSSSVPALAQATAKTMRYSALILGCCEKDEVYNLRECAHVWGFRLPIDTCRPLHDVSTRLLLSPFVQNSDIVHIHGIWRAYCAGAGQISRTKCKPFVVSAHGMLDDWAIHNKQWKKALYSAIIERPNLRSAACLRALTGAEAENYRHFGLSNPIAVIPNGVSPPEQFSPQCFLEKYPELQDKRVVLFLSRIHHKKGVDLLCRAWAEICAEFPDAHLVLAGPDSENTLEKTRQLVNSLRAQGHVTFAGMLTGAEKWSAFSASKVFVLPSWSEGFSMATLEAMAASRPVIVTHHCYFPEVRRNHCGWLIHPSVDELKTALGEALAMPQSELDRMGENGKQLVSTRYTWNRVGEQMAEVYDWVLGGAKPTGVEVV